MAGETRNPHRNRHQIAQGQQPQILHQVRIPQHRLAHGQSDGQTKQNGHTKAAHDHGAPSAAMTASSAHIKPYVETSPM